MTDTPRAKRRFGCLHVLLLVAAATVVTAVACYFAFKALLFPQPFDPVTLDSREEAALQTKLEWLDFESRASTQTKDGESSMEPEAYGERPADRTIRFTEKELNALLAKNTDLADKVVIDLSPGLVSAKLRIPMDEDMPMVGGKTLRVRAGLSFDYAEGKPVVMFKGLTVMGVPIPKAWLGGIKNVDLLREHGGDAGFWKAFGDGVESLRVEDGSIVLQLKE